MRKTLLVVGLLCGLSLSAQNRDSVLYDAYQREDMTVWKEYLDTAFLSPLTSLLSPLLYEYGLCGYMVDREKDQALPYVQNLKSEIINHKSSLPVGHYEMYMSAVYVFELRLHESVHPIKAMSLAKEATQLAPTDPLVLSYYGTCLFYAPKPIGSKQEALNWFTKAQTYFKGEEWRFCWVREANEMYIGQCKEKLKMH